MLEPIDQFIKKLRAKDPKITPGEMLHALHQGGYERKTCVLKVKEWFPDLVCSDMCKVIVDEYSEPLIDKKDLKDLLACCQYSQEEIEQAVGRHYPKSLGYVMMLDDSISMKDASAMIKIDAKAFLDCSRTGDSFGFNKFDVDASWIYPAGSDPAPAVITESEKEKKECKAAIDALTTSGRQTNIGAAVSLAENMVKKMDDEMKALVLISDGEANIGVKPDTVLLAEPPIYIAGLGYWMRREYFDKMLEKNSRSKFFLSPNAYDMMKVFNQIIADSSDSLVGLNSLDLYQGINYAVKDFSISENGNMSYVSVVWSDASCQYTSGYPEHNTINVVLIDPEGRQTDIKPEVVEAGYCIFKLYNVKPGTWHILSQYVLDRQLYCTVGVIEKDPPVQVRITGNQTAGKGEHLGYEIEISEAGIFKNLSASAICSAPAIDVETVFNKYGEIPREEHTEADVRLLQRRYVRETARRTDDGIFSGCIGEALNSGIYHTVITIKGEYKNGSPFSCSKMHSVIVG